MAIDLEEVKGQLRILDDSEDDALGGLIADAQDFVERYTSLVLTRREITETFLGFDKIKPRAWPVVSDEPITLSYLNASGVVQSFPDARLRAAPRPAAVILAPGSVWPRCSGEVTVTFTAGFDTLPPAIRRAMLILIGGWYADREGGATAQAAESAATSILKKAGFRLQKL